MGAVLGDTVVAQRRLSVSVPGARPYPGARGVALEIDDLSRGVGRQANVLQHHLTELQSRLQHFGNHLGRALGHESLGVGVVVGPHEDRQFPGQAPGGNQYPFRRVGVVGTDDQRGRASGNREDSDPPRQQRPLRRYRALPRSRAPPQSSLLG